MKHKFAGKVLGSLLQLIPLLLALWSSSAGSATVLLGFAMLWLPIEFSGRRFTGLALVLLHELVLRYGLHNSIFLAAAILLLALPLLWLHRKGTPRASLVPTAAARLLPPVSSFLLPLFIGAAVIVTLYHCSGYFAVGAQGTGLQELLRSYRMLGFHPNWRTVLFSTIMMVILITWPRKFKRLSKTLPAGFVGVTVVTLLNCLLNPDPLHSAVAEFSASLPLLGRLPVSALSMLLIFAAWENIPFGRVREIVRRRRPLELALLICGPVAVLLLFR